MAHKLVGFAHSDNQSNVEYIKSQLSAIANDITGLQTEFANQNDSRLQRHTRKPDRLPCLMLFKNDSYKAHVHAKFSYQEALTWAKAHIG